MDEHQPMFNLKAVIHETGLTPATLRAWERRYGLFKPQRSPGGHRLYTLHEIEMLKWLVARQAEGLSISHAIELWRSLEKSPPGAYPVTTPGTALAATSASGVVLDQLRDNWIRACLNFDEVAAEQALTQALAIAPPEVACNELLQKGIAEIGSRWYKGKISVQQEHFASALASRRLNALFSAAPPATRSGRLLAACPPGETHDLALLMLSFALRWNGWDVVYLGANVPLPHLDDTLQSTHPVLVLSVAQTLPGAAALNEMAAFVNHQGVPLAFGGGIFVAIPDLIRRISGHYLGNDLTAVPQRIGHLVTHQPQQPALPPLERDYEIALAGFKEKQGLIIASVNQILKDGQISTQHLEEANTHLTLAIGAALSLGDIRFLDHSIGWLKGLLENYGLSPTLARLYFSAYHRAVQQHLGEQASPILAWFEQLETATAPIHPDGNAG
jgi:DNA-binding transcriptional MerR regulator